MMLQGMIPGGRAGPGLCAVCCVLCAGLTLRLGHGRCPGLTEESFYNVGCSFWFLGHILYRHFIIVSNSLQFGFTWLLDLNLLFTPCLSSDL